MNGVPFSLRRVRLIAQNTLREAARQRLFNVIVFLALGLVLGARWFRDFNFGAPELKFLADCGLGAMAFFGAALTIVATAQLFFSEIENRTALTLLAKPVWRTEFIVGKFLGVVALMAVFCAVLTLLLIAVLWRREAELLAENPEAFAGQAGLRLATVALAGFLHWLKLTVLAGFVLLVASFAQTQLFAMAMGFFILVICHLQYLAQDSYARAGSAAGMLVGAAVATVFPNFQVFALADALVVSEEQGTVHVGTIAAYAAGYAVATVALAVFSFRRREV
jgi:ABC-type transport system involved in multi-copper enzyme maturation permease subunit